MHTFFALKYEMHQCQSKFENANLHTNLHRVTKVPLSSGKLKSCTKKPFQRAAVIPTKTLLSSTEADFHLYVIRALHFNLFNFQQQSTV